MNKWRTLNFYLGGERVEKNVIMTKCQKRLTNVRKLLTNCEIKMYWIRSGKRIEI